MSAAADTSRVGYVRVLAVDSRKWADGGVPDGGEGGIRLEEVGDDLCALRLHLIAAQTANEGKSRGVSGC